ncbi:MAG: hypothetical protein JW734_09090 [Candidatus Omnitrophica bacterium]|nr:hypothetical protein [Candidatus Omnitrophota bacterium]
MNKERIEKDRQLLIIFSLLWVGCTLWAMRYYPLVKDFNFSGLTGNQLRVLSVISFTGLFALVMTAVYVYKMYRWYNSSLISARSVTIIFVVTALFLGLISFIIVAVIIWKSKKLIVDDQDSLSDFES